MSRKRNVENDLVVSTGATAATPARRKSSAKSRGTRSAEPTETLATPAPQSEVATPVPAPVAFAPQPAQEEIATLAYLYWEARGCQGGSPEEDWLRAEQELLRRASSAV